jgi:hypothetical protein
MRQIRIKEHEGYYFKYNESDSSVPVTIYSNWRKTGKTPAVIDETYSRPLKSADDRDRLYVTIATMGKKERLYLDTLVATYVLDNPNNYDRVLHKDDNIYNCHPSNLQWMKNEDNTRKGGDPELSTKEKTFEITYSNGKKEVIKNLSKFCRENNYSESSLNFLKRGVQKKHKDIVKITKLEVL